MSVCGQVSNTVATDDLAAVTCDICRGSVTDNREAEDYSGCSYLLHPGPPDRVHLIVCERCGALVHDKDVHDEFHRGRVL
jgi:predicted metal-binding protein